MLKYWDNTLYPIFFMLIKSAWFLYCITIENGKWLSLIEILCIFCKCCHLSHIFICGLCRLLSWDEVSTFTCQECKSTLEKGDLMDVICDGVMIGCKKDYLQPVAMEPPPDPTPIQGSKHSER